MGEFGLIFQGSSSAGFRQKLDLATGSIFNTFYIAITIVSVWAIENNSKSYDIGMRLQVVEV